MTAAISAYLKEVRARLDGAILPQQVFSSAGSTAEPMYSQLAILTCARPLHLNAEEDLKLLVECLEVSMKALENVRRSNPFGEWPAVRAADALYDVEKLIAERVK